MPCRNVRRRPVAGATAIGLLVLFSVTGPAKTDEPCSPQEVTAEIDGRPLTREEKVAILDGAFYESLARFENCQTPVSAPAAGADLSGNPGVRAAHTAVIPKDIPDPENDDTLAAQIRAAAIAETDPQEQAELWNAYRKYKGLPAKPGRGAGISGGSGSGNAATGQTPEDDSSGSGFFVDSHGHILTNHHVVSGCNRLAVIFEGVAAPAVVRAADEANDLALVSTDIASDGAAFRTRRGKLGEAATAAGFPLSGLLAHSLNVTGGQVSALAGPGNDQSLLQITAPVQPGNSGGPLLDASGRVIGIVTSRLNEQVIASLTGSIPQNVNFAVEGMVVRRFLDKHGIDYEIAAESAPLSGESVAERAGRFTVFVYCWR